MMRYFMLAILTLSLSACFDLADSEQNQLADNIALGERTFHESCAVCHGKNAAGIVKDWKKRLPDGSFPPPPLNGTAHTWHHSPAQLLRTIDEGGIPLGGEMPGFKDKLSPTQKQAILDYLYSLWPEEIQHRYDARFK